MQQSKHKRSNYMQHQHLYDMLGLNWPPLYSYYLHLLHCVNAYVGIFPLSQAEVEEAAWTLGASPWKTFTEVLLPPLLPPLLTGTALAFSRALGEFGSIVIISSNFAFKVGAVVWCIEPCMCVARSRTGAGTLRLELPWNGLQWPR